LNLKFGRLVDDGAGTIEARIDPINRQVSCRVVLAEAR